MDDVASTEGVTNFRENQDVILFRIADNDGYFGSDELSPRVRLNKVPCDSMKVSRKGSPCMM